MYRRPSSLYAERHSCVNRSKGTVRSPARAKHRRISFYVYMGRAPKKGSIMINPIIAINNKQIVKNSRGSFSVYDIPKTLVCTIPKTVPNTISNTKATAVAIPPRVEHWPCDEASDADIKALVVDVLMPDYQRLTIEERFEENFALLY